MGCKSRLGMMGCDRINKLGWDALDEVPPLEKSVSFCTVKQLFFSLILPASVPIMPSRLSHYLVWRGYLVARNTWQNTN